MTRLPSLDDGLAPQVLTPAHYVLDGTQSLAHAIGTGLLLESAVERERELAWWRWSELVLCPRWRVVVDVAVN